MVLPIFFLFVLGIVEFGRAMMTYEVLVAAAREGARQAALPASTDAHVHEAVNRMLLAVRLPAHKFTIVIKIDGIVADTATARRGQRMSVEVWVPFVDVALSAPKFVTGANPLQAGCTMRRE